MTKLCGGLASNPRVEDLSDTVSRGKGKRQAPYDMLMSQITVLAASVGALTEVGTVESFSLRSVKLRHYRGPLYTVPFGDLGAVQNMSRD